MEAGASSDQVAVVVWSTSTNNTDDDDDDVLRSRSYKCSFCGRGFSNAQALGGHMNVHRRDRAKLNCASSSSSSDHQKYSPSQVNMITNSSSSSVAHHQHDHHDEIICTLLDCPWINTTTRNQDEGEEKDDNMFGACRDTQRQLAPLFVDTLLLPSRSSGSDHDHQEEVIIRKQSSVDVAAHGEQAAEGKLDLELRLGPDPNDTLSRTTATTTTTNTTTREFF